MLPGRPTSKSLIASIISLAKRVAITTALIAIASCGGGSADSDGLLAVPDRVAQEKAVTVSLTNSIAVTGITKVAERRISRTVYEYDFRVTLSNSGPTAEGLKAVLVAVGTGSTISDATASLNTMAANQSVDALDTITVRHDRLLPFDTSAWRWDVTGQLVTSGTTTLLVDSSVPAGFASRIVRVVGPTSQGALGSVIDLPAAIPGNPIPILLALDSSNLVLLASEVAEGTTRFSTSSTAFALARLAIGSLQDRPEILNALRASVSGPTFAVLVAAVDAAFQGGSHPMQSIQVVSALDDFLFEVQGGTVGAPPISAIAKKAIATPRLDCLPQVLIGEPLSCAFLAALPPDAGEFTPGTVSLLGQAPRLVNRTTMEWDVSTNDGTGPDVLKNPPLAAMAFRNALSTGNPFLPGSMDDLTKTKSFSLRVFQSDERKRKNVRDLLVRTVMLGIDFVPPGEKPPNIVAVVEQNVDRAIASYQTSELRSSQILKDIARRVVFESIGQVGCLTPGSTVACPVVPDWWQWGFSVVLDVVFGTQSKVWKGASLLGDWLNRNSYGDRDVTVGVCVTSAGLYTPCPITFRRDPPSTVVVGSTIQLRTGLKAFDKDNKEVFVPADLKFLAPPGSESIATVDSATGVVTGKAAGTVAITVQDPSTDAIGIVTIEVTAPANEHWVASYQFTSCSVPTSRPPLGFYSGQITIGCHGIPTYFVGIAAGTSGGGGRFYFDDDPGTDLVFEGSNGLNWRERKSSGFTSSQSSFSVSQPSDGRLTAVPCSLTCTDYPISGATVMNFTVTSRSATQISGTFTASNPFGVLWFSGVPNPPVIWDTGFATSTGVFTATKVNRPQPLPRLNGYKLCSSANHGLNYTQSLSQNCNPASLAFYCGDQAANACLFDTTVASP